MEKEMRVQMGDITFNGKDPITILPFLVRFKEACDKNRIGEEMAVYCFKKFLTGAPQHLVMSRLVGDSMATDADQTDMLTSYPEVVNFLLHTYATEEAMLEAVQDIENCRQSSIMNEVAYADRLWELALRCGTVFSSARLNSYFLPGVRSAIRRRVRYYATENPRIGFQELLAYAKAKRADYRGGRIRTTQQLGPSRSIASTRNRRASMLAVYSSATPKTVHGSGSNAEDLLLLHGTGTAILPSPPTSLTQNASLSPHTTVTNSTVPADDISKVYGTGLCRICLSAEHTVCPLISNPGERERIMLIRNANWHSQFAQRGQPRKRDRDGNRDDPTPKTGKTVTIDATPRARAKYTNRPARRTPFPPTPVNAVDPQGQVGYRRSSLCADTGRGSGKTTGGRL